MVTPILTTLDRVAHIRAALDRAGYSEARLLQLLGIDQLPTFRHRQHSLPLYLWRTQETSPLNTFIRLFFFQQSVSVNEARNAIQPQSLSDWEELGLLQSTDDEVRAAVELYPYQELILAADWPNSTGGNSEPVMGVAASSRTLAQMMIHRSSQHVLDLGTGCGLLAFLAAQQSARVVAIDRNLRAVQMTQFNAQLNGILNVSCYNGDLFAPVGQETFDLIVCNPPFVIAPGHGTLHTHSGLPTDQLCRQIIRTAPAYLREGGYCQLLCNWVQLSGQDWRERLATWFAGTGCDVWILHAHSEEAAEYAQHRINEMTEDSAHAATQFADWMAYYEREKIEAIGFGVITMRRSARETNWLRYDQLPEVIGPCGSVIERGFRLRDFLETHGEDQSLLNVQLGRAAGLRWEQIRHLTDKGWTTRTSQLQLTSGLAYAGNVDAAVMEFVERCNGEIRLGAHLKKIAAASGQKADRLAPGFLKIVRRLIELGCLLPVEET